MKNHIVFFPEKEKAAFAEEDFNAELHGTEVLIKTDYDVISAGTELANYHGLPNTGADGYGSGHGGYPIHIGYSFSGHVAGTGPDVTTLKKGDNVVVNWGGHHAWFRRDESSVVRVPAGVDMKEAAFAHLSSFPMLAVRKLDIQLGEAVMVAGLGLLGQFAVQFAKLSGAYPVLVCDFSPERRALAKQLGADFVLDPREPDFIQHVKDLTDGRGPAAVVEVTGFVSALQQALEYIDWEGRIALLGCTRVSDQCIDYYKYVHRRGIRLIGCHTSTRPKVDSKPGAWTEHDDYVTYLKLLKAGRVQAAPLIGKIADPRDADAVYREIGFSENPPLGVLLDWRNIE